MFDVYDCEVNIIECVEIKDTDDFLRELGRTVLEIDWTKIGKRLEDGRNYDGGGWEHLARHWRDDRAFSVYSYFYHRFNRHYHWLDFLDGRGISASDKQSVNILEYLEEAKNELMARNPLGGDLSPTKRKKFAERVEFVASETREIDDEPNKLVMWNSVNGDLYMSICPASHQMGISMRFERSGGCSTSNPKLLKALMDAYDAIAGNFEAVVSPEANKDDSQE